MCYIFNWNIIIYLLYFQSKEQILKHPKKFYKNIFQILEYSSNPIEGHHIERFHKYIFN